MNVLTRMLVVAGCLACEVQCLPQQSGPAAVQKGSSRASGVQPSEASTSIPRLVPLLAVFLA